MVIESAANIINFSLIPQVLLLIFEDNLHKKNIYLSHQTYPKTEKAVYFRHLQNNISIKEFNDSASIFYYFSVLQRGINRRSWKFHHTTPYFCCTTRPPISCFQFRYLVLQSIRIALRRQFCFIINQTIKTL